MFVLLHFLLEDDVYRDESSLEKFKLLDILNHLLNHADLLLDEVVFFGDILNDSVEDDLLGSVLLLCQFVNAGVELLQVPRLL